MAETQSIVCYPVYSATLAGGGGAGGTDTTWETAHDAPDAYEITEDELEAGGILRVDF